MNDATNTHPSLDTNAIRNSANHIVARKILEGSKPKRPGKSGSSSPRTPAEKLNLSDLAVQSNNSVSTPASTASTPRNGFGQYLFEDGSGDESSLASSLNSRASLGTATPSAQSSPRASKVLGTFEDTRGATTTLGKVVLSATALGQSVDGSDQFMWQSFAPKDTLAPADNEDKPLGKNPNNVQRADKGNIVDGANIEEAALPPPAVESDALGSSGENFRTEGDENFGWTSLKPGMSAASQDFVGGAEAMGVIDDGEASFNSEHKFSMAESLSSTRHVLSASNNFDGGKGDAMQFSAAMFAFEDSQIAKGKDDGLEAGEKPKVGWESEALVEDGQERDIGEEAGTSADDYFQARSLPMGTISGDAPEELAVRFVDTDYQLPKKKREKIRAPTASCKKPRSINIGTHVPLSEASKPACAIDAIESSDLYGGLLMSGIPSVEPSRPFHMGAVGYGKTLTFPFRIVCNGFRGKISVSLQSLRTYGDDVAFVPNWKLFSKDGIEKALEAQDSSTVEISVDGSNDPLLSYSFKIVFSSLKKKPIDALGSSVAPYDLLARNGLKPRRKDGYSKRAKRPSTRKPYSCELSIQSIPSQKSGAQEVELMSARVPVNVVVAPRNCLQVPPGLSKVTLASCAGKATFFDLPVHNGGCNTISIRARILPMKRFPNACLSFNCDSTTMSLPPSQTDAIRILYAPIKGAERIMRRGKQYADRAKLVLEATHGGRHEIVIVGKLGKGSAAAKPTAPAVIVPQQKDVQFGSVAQGITSEAIVSIRSIVDVDLSVRCRVADISSGSPASKPEESSFKVVTPSLIQLKARQSTSIVLQFTPKPGVKSRGCIVLSASSPKLPIAVAQTRIAVSGFGKAKKTSHKRLPTRIRVIKIQDGESRMSLRQGKKHPGAEAKKRGKKAKKKTNASSHRRGRAMVTLLAQEDRERTAASSRKPQKVKAKKKPKSQNIMLLQKVKLSTRIRFDERDLDFGTMVLGKKAKRAIVLSNPSENEGFVSVAVKDRTGPFQVANSKSCRVFLKAKESVGLEVTYNAKKMGVSNDCLVAWKGNGNDRATITLKGESI
jgi:hypothetical protein